MSSRREPSSAVLAADCQLTALHTAGDDVTASRGRQPDEPPAADRSARRPTGELQPAPTLRRSPSTSVSDCVCLDYVGLATGLAHGYVFLSISHGDEVDFDFGSARILVRARIRARISESDTALPCPVLMTSKQEA